MLFVYDIFKSSCFFFGENSSRLLSAKEPMHFVSHWYLLKPLLHNQVIIGLQTYNSRK